MVGTLRANSAETNLQIHSRAGCCPIPRQVAASPENSSSYQGAVWYVVPESAFPRKCRNISVSIQFVNGAELRLLQDGT